MLDLSSAVRSLTVRRKADRAVIAKATGKET